MNLDADLPPDTRKRVPSSSFRFCAALLSLSVRRLVKVMLDGMWLGLFLAKAFRRTASNVSMEEVHATGASWYGVNEEEPWGSSPEV